MKYRIFIRSISSIFFLLLVLSLVVTGCSKADNNTTAASQNGNIEENIPEITQPQSTDNRSFPGTRPENVQFGMGLDMVKLSGILGIEQEKVEAAFSEAVKNMFSNVPSPFTGNMSGMKPPVNLSGEINSGDSPDMQFPEDSTGGQPPSAPEGRNFRPNSGVPDAVIEAAAEILELTPQELEDAIAELDS